MPVLNVSELNVVTAVLGKPSSQCSVSFFFFF